MPIAATSPDEADPLRLMVKVLSRLRMPRLLRALLLALFAALLARPDRPISPDSDNEYDDELADLIALADRAAYEHRRAIYGWHWRGAPNLGMNPTGGRTPLVRPHAPARAPPMPG